MTHSFYSFDLVRQRALKSLALAVTRFTRRLKKAIRVFFNLIKRTWEEFATRRRIFLSNIKEIRRTIRASENEYRTNIQRACC